MRRKLPDKGRFRNCVSVLLLLAAVPGCGEGGTATVSGKVVYKGAPVTFGAVAIYGADGKTASGRIDADGHYTVEKVPIGDVKVAVLTPNPTTPKVFSKGGFKSKSKGKVKDSDSEVPNLGSVGKFVAIPARYKEPDQSGLTFTIKSGSQTIDLELKP